MIVNRASLVGVVLRLAAFYWAVCTLVFVGEDITRVPDLLLAYQDVLIEKVWYLAFTALVVFVVVLLKIVGIRELRRDMLRGRPALGFTSSLGRVPTPVKPAKRLPSQERIPILDERVQLWLLAQGAEIEEIIPLPKGRVARQFWRETSDGGSVKEGLAVAAARRKLLEKRAELAARLPEPKDGKVSSHAALFLAIWDTLCAHAHYPASHRQGGHGKAKLYAHSMRVAARCLHEVSADGGAWEYGGVYSKRRGRVAVRVFENTTKYRLNPLDPLIPIVGLAHDLGKIDAYVVSRRGEIKQNKEPRGNTLSDDERGVVHDKLGPRIIAKMPEFWTLRPQDRSLLSMAVGHYHHPSQFPLDSHGLVCEPRSAALMMLLVKADREVSSEETGVVAGAANEMTADDLEEIYETFVKIITEPGRINGVGNPEEDAKIRIGQKQEDFIVVKASALMSLIRQELNLSLAAGEHKHDLLNHLLTLLKDKGILYDQHNGADLSLYSPLYRVSLYHAQSMKHITDLVPALLLKIPGVELAEFYHLTHLACNPHTAVVRGIVLSHIPKHRVKDPTHLNAAVVRAFGEEEAEQDLHAEVAEDAILSPVAVGKSSQDQPSASGAHDEEEVSPSAPDRAVEAAVRDLADDEKALQAAARLLAKKSGKGKKQRSASLADLGAGDAGAEAAAEEFAEAWTNPQKPRSTRKTSPAKAVDGALVQSAKVTDVDEPSQGGHVSEEPPWLFEDGQDNSQAPVPDEVPIDPTFELDFGREELIEDDEPGGFDQADEVLDGSAAIVEPPQEPHTSSSVRPPVDLSDDVVVSAHAPNAVEAEAEPVVQPAPRLAENVAKSGKQQSKTRVALDTF